MPLLYFESLLSLLSRESLLSRLLPVSFLIRERDPSMDDVEQDDVDEEDVVEDGGRTVTAMDMEVWYWPVDDVVVGPLAVEEVVEEVTAMADVVEDVAIVVIGVAVTGAVVLGYDTVDGTVVATTGGAVDDVVLSPRLVEAPRTCTLLTLPLLLRILLADAKPLLLPPLLAVAPLPRPIGNETGGNSGLTVLIDVPGVIGVAGVGCTQLCCCTDTPRGSVVVFSAVDTHVVKFKLEDRDAMLPPNPVICPVVDDAAPLPLPLTLTPTLTLPMLLLLLPLLADCTGG